MYRAHRSRREQGFALVYTALFMTTILLTTGLAVDTGRAYLVKAQLSKAVDGAALGAARMLNSGVPKTEATRIFQANFPSGFMGTLTTPDPTAASDFFDMKTVSATGLNVVTVKATAKLPTTFMRLGSISDLTVSSTGQATRRMVDLSLILDVSSSIGSQWSYVRDAARTFVNSFDAANDRVAFVTYGNGAHVVDQMPSSRGFNKTKVVNDIPSTLPGGSTAMVEGLYRGWDELRAVPGGSQSGLRIIVLFTDGASNSVPGDYPAQAGVGRGLRTYDFPKNLPDPDGQTWNNPQITGLYDTDSGAVSSPSYGVTVANWNDTTVLAAVPYLPLNSCHSHHRSAGI